MLCRTADHLFWMSRYTERAGDMPQAFAGKTDKCAQRLSCRHQNTPGALAPSVFEARN